MLYEVITMKTIAVGQLPDRAHLRLAIGERAADTVQLALVELPHEHAIEIAAEGDLLDRDVDMLAEPMRTACEMRGHRARSKALTRSTSSGVSTPAPKSTVSTSYNFV